MTMEQLIAYRTMANEAMETEEIKTYEDFDRWANKCIPDLTEESYKRALFKAAMDYRFIKLHWRNIFGGVENEED